jgi:hypothetical protein
MDKDQLLSAVVIVAAAVLAIAVIYKTFGV